MTDESDTPKTERTGGAWAKGQSGNPAGKPPGTRHKITMLAEQLMEAGAEGIVSKVIALAKDGDLVAARLVLDRILPTRRGRPVTLDLPAVQTAADLPGALGAVVAAVATGELTPEEGQAFAAVLEASRRSIETADLEARIAALEATHAID
jgi:hypothetical protein